MATGSDHILTQMQIETAVDAHSDELEGSLFQALEGLIGSYGEVRERTGKGELAYIYISLMRTAIPFKAPLYRIDLCDSQKQLDPAEHSARWDISFLSDMIYTDRFRAGPIVPRSDKQKYLMEQDWFENAGLLHEVLFGQIYDICDNVLDRMDLGDASQVTVYMGEYSAKAKFLMTYRQERLDDGHENI